MITDRLAAALDATSALGADSLLVTDLVEVRYLSGFSGSNGAVLLGTHRPLLATDGRYTFQAVAECPGWEVITTRELAVDLLRAGAALGISRVAADRSRWDLRQEQLAMLAATEAGIVIVDSGDLLQTQRMTKESAEIEALAEAAEITVEAWQRLLQEGLEGRSELDLAGRLEHLFRFLGAEDRAFPTILAAGPHSAVPHHQPTSRLIERGDLVKIDCGARVRGYHADFTRTVVVGEPAAWQREIHSAVIEAHAAATRLLRPGVGADQLDQAARSVVEMAGFGDNFVHPLGHGVGLEIHERPILGRDAAILRPNMALTIEPGVYLPGLGGVRIEDTVLVTEAGHRNLTNADRGLISL